ncbi:protein of unknown function [Paenibacillus alvei]|uniref:Mutator family transposase n=1 Tax=Paenibacillus alvei TaxID=44250 RepID=A0A383R802_PAEAL|nr:protein of unknown function [Paenibacillus alvei]
MLLLQPNRHVWNELLIELKERGVEEVLFFIFDGLKGIVTAIEQVYTKSKYQLVI